MNTSTLKRLRILLVATVVLVAVAVGSSVVPFVSGSTDTARADTANKLWSEVIEEKLDSGYSGKTIWPSLYTAKGTEEDPYVITTAEQLAFFAYVVNNSKMNTAVVDDAKLNFVYVADDPDGINDNGYKIGNFSFAGKTVCLRADIDISAYYWVRIGYQYFAEKDNASTPQSSADEGATGSSDSNKTSRPFLGTFTGAKYDGDDLVGIYTISGLTIDETQEAYKTVSEAGQVVSTGLFGYVGARYDAAYYDELASDEEVATKYNEKNSENQYRNKTVIAGTVSNVRISDAKINVRYSAYVGIVAGVNAGIISDCYTYGSISGNSFLNSPAMGPYFGGIAGYVRNGDIIQCSNHATVDAKQYVVGGIVGRASVDTIGMEPFSGVRNASIIGCTNLGDVTGGISVGGIVGHSTGMVNSANKGQYVISSCRNEGKVLHSGKTYNATSAAGGLVGYLQSGVVTGCYVYYPSRTEAGVVLASDTTSKSIPIGGLAGIANGTVNASYAYVNVANDVSTSAGALFGSAVINEPKYDSYYIVDEYTSSYADKYLPGKEDTAVGTKGYRKMSLADVTGNTSDVIASAFSGWSNIESPLMPSDKNWVFTAGSLPSLSIRTLKIRYENVSNTKYVYDGLNKEITVEFYPAATEYVSGENYDYAYNIKVFSGNKVIPDGSGYSNLVEGGNIDAKVSDGKITLPIKDAGEYLIVVRVVSDDLKGYFYGEFDYTVAKKELKVFIDSKSAVYGESKDAFNDFTVDGLVSGDVCGGTITRADGKNAGVYSYNLSTVTVKDSNGNDSENYNLVLQKVNGKTPVYTINKKEVKITDITSLTMPYGHRSANYFADQAHAQAVASVQSGVITGDTVNIKELRFTDAESAVLDAATYEGRLHLSEVVLTNSNYYVNVSSAKAIDLIVSKVQLQIASTAAERTYNKPYGTDYVSFENYGYSVTTQDNEVIPESTARLLGITFVSEGAAKTAAYDQKYPVYVAGIQNQNYTVSTEEVVGYIFVKAPPTISLRDDAAIEIATKYYDGTNSAQLSDGFTLQSGMFENWDGSIMTVLPQAEFFFQSANVGENISVDVVFTVPEGSPYGMLKTKYTAVAKADIAKREVTVNVADCSVVYGTWNVETGAYAIPYVLDYTFAGDGLTAESSAKLGRELDAVLLFGHTLNITEGAKYAGEYKVSGDVNFDEASLSNFFLKRGKTVTEGRDDADSATVTVSKRTVSIPSDFLTSSSKEYDGTTAIAIKVNGETKVAGENCYFVHSTGVLAEDSSDHGDATGLYFVFASEFTSPNVGQASAKVRLTLMGQNKSSYAFENGLDVYELTIQGVEITPRKLTLTYTKRMFEAEFGTNVLSVLEYDLVGIDGLEAERAEINAALNFGIEGHESGEKLLPGLYNVTFSQNASLKNYVVTIDEGKEAQIKVVTAVVGNLTFESSTYEFVYGNKVDYPSPMLSKGGSLGVVDNSKMSVSLELKQGGNTVSMTGTLNAGEYVLVCSATAKEGYSFTGGSKTTTAECRIKIAKKDVYVSAPNLTTVQGKPVELDDVELSDLVYWTVEDGAPCRIEYSKLGEVGGTFKLASTNAVADRAGSFNITFVSSDFNLRSTNYKFTAITAETVGFGSDYVGKLTVGVNDFTIVEDDETGIKVSDFNDNSTGELEMTISKVTDLTALKAQLTSKQTVVASFEIYVEKDGEEYTCKNAFTVRIPVPTAYVDGERYEIDVKVLGDDGTIVDTKGIILESDDGGYYAKLTIKNNGSYVLIVKELEAPRQGNENLVKMLIAAGAVLILIATVVTIVLIKRSQKAQKDSEVLAQNAVESVRDTRVTTPEDAAIREALKNKNAENPMAPQPSANVPLQQPSPQAAVQQNVRPQVQPQAQQRPTAQPTAQPRPQQARPTAQQPMQQRPQARPQQMPQAPQKMTAEQRAEMIRRASGNGDQNGKK